LPSEIKRPCADRDLKLDLAAPAKVPGRLITALYSACLVDLEYRQTLRGLCQLHWIHLLLLLLNRNKYSLAGTGRRYGSGLLLTRERYATPYRKRSIGEVKASKTPRVRVSTEPSFLVRLGVLYAHPLRLKIVSELYMREMSPTQAFEEFDSGSYGQMLSHFKRLEEYGWLRWVRSEKTAGGRGRPRNIYRATELELVDDDTWAELPTSIQVAFTARTLQQLGERVGGALAADTVDTGRGRFFRCRSIHIDDRAWEGAMTALADCFHSLAQEQIDAKIRLDRSTEKGCLMTFTLAGFEMPPSPIVDQQRRNRGAVPLRLDIGQVPLSTRIAKVLADPLNLKIVKTLHIEPMNPTQLFASLGGRSLWSIDRRCQMLTELGWLVRDEDQTDARSVLYRAAGPEVFDADVWKKIPEKATEAESWPIFNEFCTKATEALRQGSFNARKDRHVTWFTFLLDERGWRQASVALWRCDKELSAVGQAARSRTAAAARSRSVLPPYIATFLLTGFEDPVKWHEAVAC
jgi:hypothetical protein